ncbi:hypothetical protein ABZ517_14765 [Streptomyces scabiei]|uniref:hypothetical protein n=1 Tax=Streptomyces scabiei TaxID=1930 RepID=UPI00340D8436
MSAALRVAHAAETIRARWEQRVVDSPQVEAAQALEDTCQLLDPEVAAELKHLREQCESYRLQLNELGREHDLLQAERHTTNESLSEAAEQLRVDRDRIAELEAAPVTVFRAEHPDSGITLGHYSTIAAAHQHCETLARRDGNTGIVSWVPEDSDPWSPEELTFFDVQYCDGDDVPVQTCTGYVVTPLEAASEYDPDADE